jgi:hypothetical protein
LKNITFESTVTDDLMHHAAAEFVFGTSSFGRELQREDELGLPTLMDFTLHEMAVNLGLSPPQDSSKLTDDEAYYLMCKIDFQIDEKVQEWKRIEEGLRIQRDDSVGQAGLREIQDYFLDAQSIISRIKPSPRSPADRLQAASIRTTGKTLLEVHNIKEGLREGESSFGSGMASVHGLFHEEFG